MTLISYQLHLWGYIYNLTTQHEHMGPQDRTPSQTT